MSHPLCLVFEPPRAGVAHHDATPSRGGPTSRIVELTPGVALCVGGDGRSDGRPVAGISWRDGRPVLRDLTGRGFVARGQRHRESPLAAGDLLALDRLGDGARPAEGRTRVLVAQRLPDEPTRLPEVPTIAWQGLITGSTRGMVQLFDLATAAGSQAPVWIRGESGTGKELAAHAIHAAGARAKAPFEALNCAALPDNLIESELFGVERGAYTGAMRSRAGAFVRAHGGTIFLDEVGELPLAAQAKLLRVLETGEVRPVGGDRAVKVDVRVLAASWRDLEQEVARGRFRHDLLHRLWVLGVELAPLRERPADIAPILRALLAPSRSERGGVEGHDASDPFGSDPLMPDPWLLARMESQLWPGNVRELKNCVARAVATGRPIDLLPMSGAAIASGQARRPTMRRDEVLNKALELNRGNRARSARALGISRSTLYRWMASCAAHPGHLEIVGANADAGTG